MNNINPINCYSALNQKSSVLVEYCQKIIDNENSVWYPYIGWDVNLVPREVILEEPILSAINKKFIINRAAVLMSEPYQNYEWHTDQYRGVCINMLLSHDHMSHCLFGTRKNETNVYFHELKYQPSTFYIFNNQFPHSVINFDKPRYLFSLEFVDSVDSLLYPEVYKWCKNEGLV
jgi:hypothetical protein